MDASADQGESPASPPAKKKKRPRKPRADGTVPTSSDDTAPDSDDKLVAPSTSGEVEPKSDSDSDLARARPGSADLTSSDTAHTAAFVSSDAAASADRPRLVVTYRLP